MKKSTMLFVLGVLCASLSGAAPIYPYILGAPVEGEFVDVAAEVTTALEQAGFEVVGSYSPYEGASVIAATHPALLEAAAASEKGGFAAAVRIGVTDNAGTIEVSYTNPDWMANIYRLDSDLAPVSQALERALGREREFGCRKGKEAKQLRKYHYMAFMPFFDDTVLLAEHASHEAAVDAVEAGLASGTAGTTRVYRVDVPGKEEVLFGVALAEGEGADEAVMAVTDTGDPKHTAHLPYELLVSGNEVYTLHGKFRIAQSFPDLGMGTFMKISGAPKAIHGALESVSD